MLATHSQPDASRSAAKAALRSFLPNAGLHYASTRNFDYGLDSRDNVSRLSPYLRHRLILEEQVVEKVLAVHPWPSSEKFVQEVLWRTYFKGWLEQRPDVWRDYQRDVHLLAAKLDHDSDLRRRYAQAIDANTGIDCFDAWVCELREAGYLHNHARMWFASIWIYTLQLPWQLGADFFLQHLLDGDPASNTLSWRWVCGLHTRGKTYLARASNIEKFTDGRFSPVGQLASQAPPVEDDRQYAVQELPAASNFGFQRPFVLLITAEDCSPDSLALAAPPAAIVALTSTPTPSPLGKCDRARRFAASAVAEGAAHASTLHNVPCTISDSDDWPGELLQCARENDVTTIATAYAPVGPVADRLAALAPELASEGLQLERLRRPWDSECWPHATRGFFALRKKIPDLLARLGIA